MKYEPHDYQKFAVDFRNFLLSNLPSTFSITRILLSIHLDQIFCMENKTFADMPFLVDSAHTPASGIRWKFSGNTVNADRIRWEQPKLLCSCSCLFFFL